MNDSPINYNYCFEGYEINIKSTDIDCCVGTSKTPNLYLVGTEEKVKSNFTRIIRKKLDSNELPEKSIYEKLKAKYRIMRDSLDWRHQDYN